MCVFLRRLGAALPGRVRGGLPEVALISMQAAAGARSGARGWRGSGRRGEVGRRRVCCRGIFPLWDLPGPVATEQAAVAVMGRRTQLPLNASNKWAAGGSRAAGAAAVPAAPRWAAPSPLPGKAPGGTVAGALGLPGCQVPPELGVPRRRRLRGGRAARAGHGADLRALTEMSRSLAVSGVLGTLCVWYPLSSGNCGLFSRLFGDLRRPEFPFSKNLEAASDVSMGIFLSLLASALRN